jgi:serine/threonine protein kinase
MLKQRG